MNNKITQEAQAIHAEALRCLYCVDAPCRTGCPAGIDIARFIRHLRCDDLKSAKQVIKEANPLGGICGYLCPSQELCQQNCTRAKWDEAVHIRELQKYICDQADYTSPQGKPCGKKVAVVGAGPAGLACASKLAEQGVAVRVFEKGSAPGGLVDSEIPDYRIAAQAAKRDLSELENDLIQFHYNTVIDRTGIETLSRDCDAVFLGTGLSADRTAGIPVQGQVTTASRFLSQVKRGETRPGGTVFVIGGGDSAVDAAEAAVRGGADRAVIAYRRSRKEMPATDETLVDALLEGVEILYSTSLVAVTEKDGRLELSLVQNRLRQVPGETRRVFELVEGSEHTQLADLVVFALGKTDSGQLGSLDELDSETLRLGGGPIFAGGDLVNGGQTVVEAVRMGKQAAESICAALGL